MEPERGPTVNLMFTALLEHVMACFTLADGLGIIYKRGPHVTARRHIGDICYAYIELDGGIITLRSIKLLQDYMEEWVKAPNIDGPGLKVKGLTFWGCEFAGPAAAYYAEQFPYTGIEHIVMFNCECGDVDKVSVGVVNPEDRRYGRDSVHSFVVSGNRQWPENTLSSIVTRFIENNRVLRRLVLDCDRIDTTTRGLQALVDRCNLPFKYLPCVELHLDLRCKQQADLVRDLLGHEKGSLNTLSLLLGSQDGDNLSTILSGLATNNGGIEKLYLQNEEWRVSDWEMLLTSLQSNHKLQLTELYTGELIGKPSDELITNLNVAFHCQFQFRVIDTPGMEQLRFFELRGMVARALSLDLNMSRAYYEPITDNFLQNHPRVQRIFCEPGERWNLKYGNDEKANAERLGAIYYALRAGCGMHDWQALVNPYRIHPEENTLNEPVNKKRKLP